MQVDGNVYDGIITFYCDDLDQTKKLLTDARIKNLEAYGFGSINRPGRYEFWDIDKDPPPPGYYKDEKVDGIIDIVLHKEAEKRTMNTSIEELITRFQNCAYAESIPQAMMGAFGGIDVIEAIEHFCDDLRKSVNRDKPIDDDGNVITQGDLVRYPSGELYPVEGFDLVIVSKDKNDNLIYINPRYCSLVHDKTETCLRDMCRDFIAKSKKTKFSAKYEENLDALGITQEDIDSIIKTYKERIESV